MAKLSSIVLAGGESRRMGLDKRKLSLFGKSYLSLAVDKAQEISTDIIVSLGNERHDSESFEGVRVVFDDEKNRGPLFALLTALRHCRMEYVALMPVDAPLLQSEIYKPMIALIKEDPSIDAVVPKGVRGSEPLYGIYNVKSFREACNEAVENGFERVQDALGYLKNLRFIDIADLRSFDTKLLSFHNINTPLDLELLMEKVDEKSKPK
jgi:molybdopterin-guanine dinucleotide biosynthesis protein A